MCCYVLHINECNYAAAMPKRCKVIKPDDLGCQNRNTEQSEIKWELRFLCQEEKEGNLQCPINARGSKCGYEYLATNLLEFQKLNSLPANIRINKLDEGLGIAETLSLHKSCYLKFTTSNIQRLKRGLEAMDNASSPKKTRRRLNVSSSYQVPKCFFCDDSRVVNCIKTIL